MQKSRDSGALKGSNRSDFNGIGALFDRFYGKIFRFLYYKTGDQKVAEDLASEVFVRLLRSETKFQEKHSFSPAWLFTIARNLAIDYYRSHAAHPAESLEETFPEHGESTEAAIQRTLDIQVLYKAIKMLPDDQAEVIQMRFINNMSVAETAQAMERSEDAVKALQRRALTALREVFSKWEVHYD